MIRIRIDDVMWHSSAFTNERAENRFKQIHRWICQQPDSMIHIPTILVTEIQDFPNIIELVRQETLEGTMSPQLHGYEHISYGELDQDVIEDHLDKSMVWFGENLGIEPSIWATPWGGTSDTMVAAASKYCLEIETVNSAYPYNFGKAIEIAKDKGVQALHNETVFGHWWNKGLKLLRLVEIVKYGGYEEAIKGRKDNGQKDIFS